MSYTSLIFAGFLVCLLLAYVLTPNRYKWITLLVFSLVFYAYSGWEKLLFLLGTSGVVYGVSRRMESLWRQFDAICKKKKLSGDRKKELREQYKRRSKHALWLALAVSLGIMCWCKFGAPALGLVNRMTGHSWTVRIIVPLGMSYYTFSAIGYLLDIHWRKIEAEHSYPKLLLCMIYFPHVVEGPISRYNKILPQFDTLTNPSYDRFCMGAQLMLWGYLKKMVIADRLAIFVNGVLGNIGGNQGLTFVVAAVFGAFWVYADFSGCMDIVMGVSDIIGIKLDRNFNHPFFSQSAAEFWRRWHITLGTWFKDYVYVPVTTSSVTRTLRRSMSKRFGPKAGKAVMTVVPLAVVWFLTGVWHGTGWNYIVWGMYWGLLIIISTLMEDVFKSWSNRLHIDTESKPWAWFRMIRTSAIYVFGCLFTLSGGLKEFGLTMKQMFSSFNPWIFWDGSLYNYGLDRRNMCVAVLSIVFLLIVDAMQEHMNVRQAIARRNIVLRWAIYFAGIFAVIILGIYGPGYNAQDFIYMNF